jgi:hypothetical protein
MSCGEAEPRKSRKPREALRLTAHHQRSAKISVKPIECTEIEREKRLLKSVILPQNPDND